MVDIRDVKISGVAFKYAAYGNVAIVVIVWLAADKRSSRALGMSMSSREARAAATIRYRRAISIGRSIVIAGGVVLKRRTRAGSDEQGGC